MKIQKNVFKISIFLKIITYAIAYTFAYTIAYALAKTFVMQLQCNNIK